MSSSIERLLAKDIKGSVDFALIAIREDEFEAVLHYFPPTAEAEGEHRTYEISDFQTAEGSIYRAAILRSLEQGHAAAQAATSDVISDLDPAWIVLVGIAGAVPEFEFSLGDVVLATRMIDFSITAALDGGTKETAHRGAPVHKAVQDFVSRLPAFKSRLGDWNHPSKLGVSIPLVSIEEGLSHITDDNWKDKLRRSLKHRFGFNEGNTPRQPIVTAAPIASGNMLVKDHSLLQDWLESARDLKAVEMELPGVFEAARRKVGDIPVLAVRGISDIVGFKRDPAWTAFACKTAASLARALLNLKPVMPRSKQQSEDISKNITDKISSEHSLFANGAITAHHGEDAKTVLDAILKRRVSPGQDTLVQLNELARSLDDSGKFAAAPSSIKSEVYDWVVRIAASNGHLADAEHALTKLKELKQPASIAAQAWMEAARGEIDAALRMLRSEDSAAGRSNIFAILRTKKGDTDALAYLDKLESINPDLFTAIGWTNVMGCLAVNDRIEQATNLISILPDEMLLECTILRYFCGMLYVANSVPIDLHRRVIHEEFLAVSDHLLEGDEAENWRSKAYEAFEACSQIAKNAGDESLLERSKTWLRWLRIVDPAHRREELDVLRNDMNDGKTAVKLMPLAHAFGVNFDVSALTKHLGRAEILGGLTPIELNAKLLLLQHLNQFQELASFIVDNWSKLLEVESLPVLSGTLIQTYVQAGECGLAEEVLKAKQAELYADDIPRFQLMIQHCRGEDPTKQAKDNYEITGKIEDLSNLILSLEKAQRLAELTPYALEMFNRERNKANALRYVKCLRSAISQDEDIVHFLDRCNDLVKKEPELMSAQAWALFHLGELKKSEEINNQLLNIRNNINDLSLDIYLSVRTGEWEKLPAILNREWNRRGELPVALLLDLARLTAFTARERALQLVSECTEREPNNPRSLLQAHFVAIALAQDDIAMPLLNRARQSSRAEDNLIKSLSTREVVEFMQDSAIGWRKKNELFRNGSIPIHWAAHIFNVPLSRLLIAIPHENKVQADARRRQPIPIRAGNRRSIRMLSVKRLALDVTSIFILNELSFLEHLFDILDEALLSPRFMEMLYFEEEKVKFHQPSRIKVAKPLLELQKKGLLILEETSISSDLATEVGEEEAALLSAAKHSGGIYIHSGKLYRVDSYMEEEARLGDFSGSLADPVVIAHALCDEGFITEAKRDASLEYLELVSAGGMSGLKLARSASVFLDRVSAEYLFNTELLEVLINSGRKVFIHPDAFDEWQALVDTERYSVTMIEILENIRRVIRGKMAEGKVKFLREGKRSSDEEHFGISALSLVDLLEDVSGIDAACIDDRMLNSKPILEDRFGRKVDLLCSLDIIDMLVERGAVTKIERAEAIHKMREWSFSTLPVDANELLEQLLKNKASETGILMESAKLRVMREYLARLHASDFLCAASDLEYLDELWQIGQKILRDLWKDEKSTVTDITARANWLVDHIIPDIELALRFAPDGKERMEDIALARMMVAVMPLEIPDGLKMSYAKWLENKIIAPYIPACSNLIDKATEKIAAWAMACAKEIANEAANEIGELGSEDVDQGVTGNNNSETSRG